MEPELESKTVMVEPVAVEKCRSATVTVVAVSTLALMRAVMDKELPNAVEKFST